MGERGRKPGGGGQGSSPRTRASLPVLSTVCPAGDGKATVPGLGVGGLSSLPWIPQSSGGSSPPQELAPLPARPLQVAIKGISSARRRCLRLSSVLTASPLLVGVDCGEKGSRGPCQPWEEAGFGSHLLCPPQEGAAISEAGQWIPDPSSVLESSSGWETSGEEDEGWWWESLGAGLGAGPRTYSTLQLVCTTSWPLSQPGKGWNGFPVCFSGGRKPPEAHLLLSLMPSMKEARTGTGPGG